MTLPVESAAEAATTGVSSTATTAPTGATAAAARTPTPTVRTLTASPPKCAPSAAAKVFESASTTAASSVTYSETAGVMPASDSWQERKDDSVVEADVLIAGTGLAGCLTAAALARRGVKVVQVDAAGIYGGAYKSLKLSELCDWVRAEGQERGTTSTSTCCSLPHVATPPAPAETAVTGTASLATDWNAAAAAAAQVAPGEEAAAKVSALALASGQAFSSPAEAGEPGVYQGVPASAPSTAAEGTVLLEQQGPVDKQHVDFSGSAGAASSGICPCPHGDCSVCCSSFSSAHLAEAKPGSAGGAASLDSPEWVCSYEEGHSNASFSLRREWQQPPAAIQAQSTAIARSNIANEAKGEETDSPSPVTAHFPSQNSVKTRAPAWGDSEGIFFSSRSFSFFPFGKADWVTRCYSSSQPLKPSVKERPSCVETNGHAEGRRERPIAAATAARGESSAPLAAADTAEASEHADLENNCAAQKPECTAGCGSAATEALSRSDASSSGPAFVRGAAITAGGRSCEVPAVDDAEAVKKNLLKSNRFNIDLVPRVLYSNSAVAQILVTCGAAKYLEFIPVDSPVCVGEVDADVSGIQEPWRGGPGGGASEELATPQVSTKKRQSPSAVFQGYTEADQESRGKQKKRVKGESGNLVEGTGDDGDDDASKEEELSLVQMPLTRSAIFSSSVLSVQEKRLLMKFISNVAAPKLNNQFLSAARLWNAGKHTVTRAFGGDRTSPAAPTARVTPAAQVAGASAGAAEKRKEAAGKGAPFCEAGNDASVSAKGDMLVNAFQKAPAKPDGTLEEMSWEEYLDLHQLTEKLQLYLSYGVCVSDFPLRRRANLHGKCQSTSSATKSRTGKEEANEGEKQRGMKRRREDNNERITAAPRTHEDEVCDGCCTGGSWRASEGHARLLAFVQSVGMYGNHSAAWLYPLYGTGDLPQALARAASLSGAVYMLRAGLVELKVVCRRSRVFAQTSCLPRHSLCSMPASSTCHSSPVLAEAAGLDAAWSSGKERAPACQCAFDSSIGHEAKCYAGEQTFKKEYSGYDANASFMSMFHTALANAEILEAKLETGVTVKTRLLLFEADALPPLYQRVRTCMSSAAPAHACAGYAPEPKSNGQVLSRTPLVEATAQRSDASTLPGSSNATLEHSVHVLQALPNDLKVDVLPDSKAMDPCNESLSALKNTIVATRPKFDAVDASEEDMSPRRTNAQSPVHLGELLFPVLRLRGARKSVPYAASTKRKRQANGTEEQDTTQRTEQTVAAEEEELLRRSSSLTEDALCSGQQKLCPENCPRRGVGDKLYQTVQQTKKAFDEVPAVCSTSRSVVDYYTEASCHLIAVCRKNVLNGPGFRMCVCSVRSKKTSTFCDSPGVAPNSRHRSTVNSPNASGRTSVGMPESVFRGSAYLVNEDGTQVTTSFGGPAETGRDTPEGTRNKPREENTAVNLASHADRVKCTGPAPSTAVASNSTPASEPVSNSAHSPVNSVVAFRAERFTCRRPRSAECAAKCTCQLAGTRLPSEGNTLGTAGDARGAPNNTHNGNGTCSLDTREVVSPSSVPNIARRRSSACKTSHTGPVAAWPVLVLQTDGICGTTPANYVSLHLSHIHGPGVEACGCSFHGEPPSKSYESTVDHVSTERHESCSEGYATAGGVEGGFDLCDRIHSRPACQRNAPVVEPTARIAASSLGVGVEKTASSELQAVYASCKKSEPRPCAMLMYVLRRLLERGGHREAAAQDCVFACGYVLRTLRCDVEKRLQDWQSRRFRGALRKIGEEHEVTGHAVLRSAFTGKHDGSKGDQPVVVNNAAAGLACTVNVEGTADATDATNANNSIVCASQQSPVEGEESASTSVSFTDSKVSRSCAARQNGYTHAAKETLPNNQVSVENDDPVSSASVELCGCLSLPAVPSTPLLFLLQEPNACRQVMEVLLDKQINVTDLIPAHLCQEAEDAAQELQWLSAPYEKLSEIIAAAP